MIPPLNIKTLHIELSSIPGDRCPLSHSNVRGYPYNQGFVETNLSLNDCKKIFSPAFLSNLKKIIVLGNFGDFVNNPESLEIIEYFCQHCYGEIQINTNGGARDRDFWTELGKLGTIVFFSIDGLNDTYPLSRPGVDFETVLKNAQSFIDAGGHAIWSMAVSDINAHQLNDANIKSIEMGFTDFISRKTPPGDNVIYDEQGQKIYPMTNHDFWPEKIDDTFVTEAIKMTSHTPVPPRHNEVEIIPYCVKDQLIYISATGHVYPCSWTGVDPLNFKPYARNPWRYYNPEISEYVENNHAPTVGLETAVKWIKNFSSAWKSDFQPRICQNFCGSKG